MSTPPGGTPREEPSHNPWGPPDQPATPGPPRATPSGPPGTPGPPPGVWDEGGQKVCSLNDPGGT